MTSSVLAAFLLPLVVSTMAVELPYPCSFEHPELCKMEPRQGGDFNWTRHTGTTPTFGTGPDRAADGLWYMYIESSHDAPDNRERGDKAYIQTPAFEYTGDVCIRFQYHMYGYHIGRLVVFVDTRGENNSTTFTKNGNEDTTWHNAGVNVEAFRSGERVVFMAECGEAQRGDIALDDVQIAKGLCPACRDNNGGCEHMCLTQNGQVVCSCHEGYAKNGTRCISKTPDTPVLTNTASTVQRTTVTRQPPSRTTLMVTGQQTGLTTGLQDQLINYCVEAYNKVVDADQAFELSCETEELLFNKPRDQCLREACRRGVEVVAVRNEVCDIPLGGATIEPPAPAPPVLSFLRRGRYRYMKPTMADRVRRKIERTTMKLLIYIVVLAKWARVLSPQALLYIKEENYYFITRLTSECLRQDVKI